MLRLDAPTVPTGSQDRLTFPTDLHAFDRKWLLGRNESRHLRTERIGLTKASRIKLFALCAAPRKKKPGRAVLEFRTVSFTMVLINLLGDSES